MTQLQDASQAMLFDWCFTAEEERAMAAAAGIVSAAYGERAVTMLAEKDDLYQEARILVATNRELRGLDEGVLRYRLVRDLQNLVSRRYQTAVKTVSLNALEDGGDDE